MRQSGWKEQIINFFRADELRECPEIVAEENVKMMCFLNVVTMCFSFAVGIYTLVVNNSNYPFGAIYALYFLVSLVLFLFTRGVVKRHHEMIPAIIVANYFVWILYSIVENLFCRSNTYVITSYYVLIGIGMCFLLKPLYVIGLQLFSGLLIITCIWICKPREYLQMDIMQAVVMLSIGVIMSCGVLRFRMMSLKKLEERERTLKVTALYQSIIDETQTGCYVRELESYELLYINRKAREIFDVKEADVVGTRCYRLFYHQDVACPECPAKHRNMDCIAAREVLLGGHYYAVKGKIIDWCGKEAYVEYLTDITDAKIASEQMRAAHERLQKKYEEELLYREKAVSEDVISTSRINLTQGIVEEMRVGKTDGFEKQYRHVMDFRERLAECTRKSWMTDEQNKVLSADGLLKAFEEGVTSLTEEYIAELSDGRHVWIRAEVKLLRRPETADVMAFIYNREITRARLIGYVLECIMSYEYDEIYTVDCENGRFAAMAIGQYALDEQQLEGYYSEELECLRKRTIFPEDQEKIADQMSIPAMKEQLEEKETCVLEVTLLSRNGKARHKQVRYQYLNREVGILLITLTDVEDMVKQEKEKQEKLSAALSMAREANQAKSNFLASMSHEIRTPMNAIIGLNAIIKEEIDNREQVLDCTEKLDSASKYLLALLNDILDMSRIESGNMTLQHQPFEGNKFWENVNILAKAQADMASVNYLFERQNEVSGVYVGDATRLQQIMINLINNAVKFTPREGEVKVSVTEQMEADGRAEIRVIVADNGIGISADFLPKIFDTFTQQYTESTTAYKGSGLGLSIARNFARMMDGDITVESTEGEGTCFNVRVLLDISRESAVAKDDGEAFGERDFSGKRVLLVEDHPLNTLVAQNLLTKKGIEVTHAENGEEAVQYFAESEIDGFDAILMDIRMPVMDGIEATVRIRKMNRADAATVPIIAMTANAYEEDRRRTANAGMNAHLAKPIEPKQLFKTLGEYMK